MGAEGGILWSRFDNANYCRLRDVSSCYVERTLNNLLLCERATHSCMKNFQKFNLINSIDVYLINDFKSNKYTTTPALKIARTYKSEGQRHGSLRND